MTDRTRRKRWNIIQVAEKLDALARDLREISAAMTAGRDQDAMRNFQREGVGYLRDMALLLTGEMPESEVARHQADELCAAADILANWARHPTDRSGNRSRAAQLHGVAFCITAWAEQLR